MTTTHPPLFTVGDIVVVDDKDKAYIIESRGEYGDLFFKVKFIIDKTEQSNVIQARCRVVPIFDSTSNFSSRSSRSHRHFDVPIHDDTPSLITENTNRRPALHVLQDTLLTAKKFVDRSTSSPSSDGHPLITYINTNHKTKDKGWMRSLFPDAVDSPHLKPIETGRLLFLFGMLLGQPRKGGAIIRLGRHVGLRMGNHVKNDGQSV